MENTSRTIAYVTRDIERALGTTPNSEYIIITNKTPYSESIKKHYPNYIHLIEHPPEKLLGTGDLLSHPTTKEIITATDASILVFKNTARIEPIVKANGWKLLNPRALLSEKVENKISQIDWLGPTGRTFLPNHQIIPVKQITWKDEEFILQWAHGHTGDGTVFIKSETDLNALKEKFPERIARMSDYVRGPSFTVNVVVTAEKILAGNISYQITGIPPFTMNEFSTVGNDWTLALDLLSDEELKTVEAMVDEIGQKLRTEKWLGLFGIDFMRDDERGRLVLIEINARQPASTTFESYLQTEFRKQGLRGLTTFEAHLKALQGNLIDDPLIQINDGAQIVQRLTKDTQSIPKDSVALLETAGYKTVEYDNTNENADILRIQSMRGIMESHNKFNVRGKEILSFCHSVPSNVN